MFITFEGIDFCGKTTQIKLLVEYLKKTNNQVMLIREPGGTEISENIRELLLNKKYNKMVMETELFLFSASRAQLVREKIIPELQKGNYVISDRFHDSSTAYQGYGRGIEIDIIKSIHKLAIGNLIPDITFLIDIPVEVSNCRKYADCNVEPDRIESSSKDFYEKVRNGYLEMAQKDSRFVVIDGTLAIDEIHEIIVETIQKK